MTPQGPTVLKFGGTSVKDTAAFERVREIVSGLKGESPVVVTSALAGMTDALLNAVETAKNGSAPSGFDSLNEHFDRHSVIADELLGEEGG